MQVSVAGYTLDDLRDILPKVIAAAAAEQTLENQMCLDILDHLLILPRLEGGEDY